MITIDILYRMNLTHVRYFLAVAETGGFTRAASRVHVTQPTLSAGIRRLEDWLGASLFERGRGATLTPAGIRFLARARTILEESRAARAELREAEAPQRLRLGVLRTLPTAPLGRLIGDLVRSHPNVALELLVDAPTTLQARLERGQLDVVLSLLPSDGGQARTAPLFRESYVIAAAPAHPLARRGRSSIRDLDGLPFILRPDCEVQAEAERIFEAHRVRPRIVHRSTQDDRAMALVAAGLGLALVPESLCGEEIAAVRLPELDLGRRIGLGWRDGAPEAVEVVRALAASQEWSAFAERRRAGGGFDIAH